MIEYLYASIDTLFSGNIRLDFIQLAAENVDKYYDRIESEYNFEKVLCADMSGSKNEKIVFELFMDYLDDIFTEKYFIEYLITDFTKPGYNYLGIEDINEMIEYLMPMYRVNTNEDPIIQHLKRLYKFYNDNKLEIYTELYRHNHEYIVEDVNSYIFPDDY